MNKEQIVMNAIDSSGFKPSDTAAGYINPTLWSQQVVNFLEEALVVSKLVTFSFFTSGLFPSFDNC